MKWNPLLLCCLVVMLWACNSSSVETEPAPPPPPPPVQDKQTQALLLKQDFPFDPADKNKVTGDYVAQAKIVVPADLATQSKWIMFEGPVLENDRIAYRYYADSRHRFDIYGKTVADLVMDTVSWQYHDIMNWGSDILKVGNSLGLGSPAIWYQDSLYTLSVCAEKTIEVVEDGAQRSMIRTTFTDLQIAEDTFTVVQDWSLNAGQSWSEITLRVVNGVLPDGMAFATGIVKHLPTAVNGHSDDYFYLMNWGEQSFHQENMGMAILAKQTYQPVTVADERSHALAFQDAKQTVSYRFMAAWERDLTEVKKEEDFLRLVKNATQE
ncbi:MAG: DUF4861 family protein [Bacteroidota bacterium]